MDVLYRFLAAPGIVAIGFGICHLLWMALGVGLSKRRPPLAAAPEVASRPVARVRKRPASSRTAHNRIGIAAAMPQGAHHGSVSHFDN